MEVQPTFRANQASYPSVVDNLCQIRLTKSSAALCLGYLRPHLNDCVQHLRIYGTLINVDNCGASQIREDRCHSLYSVSFSLILRLKRGNDAYLDYDHS